jgi:glycopeptide antibiotics resistance protein
MQKRITAFVLIAYSAILIKVVVFKGPMRLPEWARPGSEERAEGGSEGRGRGGPRGVGGSETQNGRRMGRGGVSLDGARLSTSRFSPLHANYVPFKTILPQLRGEPRWSSAIINLVGNTVLFVPVGILVLLLHPKMTWRQSLALGVAVGVTMEVMEGVFRVGIVDVDDVILNAFGVMIGYWMCRVWERRKATVSFRLA